MLYALFAMVLFIFTIGVMTAVIRVRSVMTGKVKARYFKLMQGEDVPEIITKTTRHFNNLFEVPTLFFVAGSLYIAMGINSSIAVVLAWLFILARVVHAFVHLTYNHPLHRMLAFNLANGFVLAMWILLVLQVSSRVS